MAEIINALLDLGPGETTYVDELVIGTFFITFMVAYFFTSDPPEQGEL